MLTLQLLALCSQLIVKQIEAAGNGADEQNTQDKCRDEIGGVSESDQ